MASDQQKQSEERSAPTPARRQGLTSLQLKRLEQQVRDFEASTVSAFSMLLDLKDLSTGLHATRLAEWALWVGDRLDLSVGDLRDVEIASLLHDVGKIGVPEKVLSKAGRLTEEEMEEIRKHSEYGWAILRQFPTLANASLLILHHHEWFDGSGYPGGLKGDQIPLGARIVAIVDAFDAMLSNRSYRRGLPIEEALARLTEAAGAQFDPELVNLFRQIASEAAEEVAGIFPSAD